MKRALLCLLASVTLAGCSTTPMSILTTLISHLPTLADIRTWTASGEALAVVAIELPSFCTRRVETRSDVALIRPDYQTVIAQDCSGYDGMGEATVWWVLVDDAESDPRAPKPDPQSTEAKAVQQFATDSARIVKPSGSLRDLVMAAKAYPGLAIRIVGHADKRGSHDYNMALGLKRAQAVANWLARQGVARDRFELSSASFDQPVASNATAAGQARNRRAEAVITLVVVGGGAS